MTSLANVLAVIPARSGSKGLPHKNIRPLLGKPLIVWTIERALECPLITDTVVSTDSVEYARIASAHGAQVPFLRPPDLAADTSSSVDVVLHALDQMADLGRHYSIVVLLEPTSPLRLVDDISQSIALITAGQASAAVGICLAQAIHPAFLFRRGVDQLLTPFSGVSPSDLRRQDVEPLFFLEGSVYTSDVSILRDKRTFYHESTAGVVIPYERSPEIDSETDFLLVETLLKAQSLK